MDNSADENSTAKHKFLLFVSGMSVKSGHAIENLREICDKYLKEEYDLEIVDISRDTEKAAVYEIVAIPTLIKTHPGPKRIIIGDLSDQEKVLKILNLSE